MHSKTIEARATTIATTTTTIQKKMKFLLFNVLALMVSSVSAAGTIQLDTSSPSWGHANNMINILKDYGETDVTTYVSASGKADGQYANVDYIAGFIDWLSTVTPTGDKIALIPYMCDGTAYMTNKTLLEQYMSCSLKKATDKGWKVVMPYYYDFKNANAHLAVTMDDNGIVATTTATGWNFSSKHRNYCSSQMNCKCTTQSCPFVGLSVSTARAAGMIYSNQTTWSIANTNTSSCTGFTIPSVSGDSKFQCQLVGGGNKCTTGCTTSTQ